jgi:hypothetical protein
MSELENLRVQNARLIANSDQMLTHLREGVKLMDELKVGIVEILTAVNTHAVANKRPLKRDRELYSVLKDWMNRWPLEEETDADTSN